MADKYYVFGTLQHNDKTFGHGEPITASDVDGKENLDVLVATGAVVTTNPIPDSELVIPAGETINSLGVDPRPGVGGVTMATDLPTPTNVPADIRSGMIGAPGGETKSVGAPDLNKSQQNLAKSVDLTKTQENPLGGEAQQAADEAAAASAGPTGVATSLAQGDTGKGTKPKTVVKPGEGEKSS